MKSGTLRRLAQLEAKRPAAPMRIFVIVGSDEPRHAGEIRIGGNPTDETPQATDVVLRLAYEQTEVTNPNPAPSASPKPEPVAREPVAVAEVPAVVLAARDRVARAYARGR